MSQPSIVFFSRGRGHGHAIPDMAIADALCALRPATQVRFVSYATGATTLRAAGRPVVDLRLPEANPFVATLLACEKVIKQDVPDLVVAHEEFAALVAGRLHHVPTAFVSAWLPASGSVPAESLACADSITVIERPGVFPVPPTVRVKPTYTGPIVRPMKYTARDRHRLRAELGWPADALCITVLPGGSASEVQSPIAELVVSAFYRLPHREKRLVWVSRNDYASLTARFAGLVGVEAVDFCDPIERLLGACDLVITKGTRGATLDAAAVGVPSVSISHGRNPVDELLVPRMRNNLSLVAGALDAEILASQIMHVSAAPRPAPMSPAVDECGAVERVARILIGQLETEPAAQGAAGLVSA